MIPDATFEPAPPRSKRRLRFSLFSLLVFMTVACFIAAWIGHPKSAKVQALLYVTPRNQVANLETSKESLLALLKSRAVIDAAVKKPELAKLPVVKRIN
jgi:hypothetical protein